MEARTPKQHPASLTDKTPLSMTCRNEEKGVKKSHIQQQRCKRTVLEQLHHSSEFNLKWKFLKLLIFCMQTISKLISESE